MWLAYSVKKEDLWVSRVPVPVESDARGPVNDDFDGADAESLRDWNIYSPKSAPVAVLRSTSAQSVRVF